MEKLCLFCQHLEYEAAGNGEYAEPAELYCKKNHILNGEKQTIYDLDDFRRMILTAESCNDYLPPCVQNS